MKSKPTHADLAGSRYLALQRLARVEKRTTAELLQLYVLERADKEMQRRENAPRLVREEPFRRYTYPSVELRRGRRPYKVEYPQGDPGCPTAQAPAATANWVSRARVHGR